MYKTDIDALNYMNENTSNFYKSDNTFDNDLYDEYRLNNMLETNDTVDYELTFNLNKKNGEWYLETPDRVMLEKLNGLYDYLDD